MNILDVAFKLEELYKESLTNGNLFYENLTGNLRISVTHNQASVINLETSKILMNILDVGICHTQDIMHGIYHTSTNSILKVVQMRSTEVEVVGELRKYIPPGESNDIFNINLDDLTEEYVFQLSTTKEFPSFEKIQMILKYLEPVRKICFENNRFIVLDINTDWDSIELTEESFK